MRTATIPEIGDAPQRVTVACDHCGGPATVPFAADGQRFCCAGCHAVHAALRHACGEAPPDAAAPRT